ncbi:hypothetical protein DFH09DRAFT_1375297 [Mycena vulgaris]|nr:hypothetical protein DFH09DRAFT_1375297 [Mycena vulgaris]
MRAPYLLPSARNATHAHYDCFPPPLSGHLSRECPEPQKRACYTCGSERDSAGLSAGVALAKECAAASTLRSSPAPSALHSKDTTDGDTSPPSRPPSPALPAPVRPVALTIVVTMRWRQALTRVSSFNVLGRLERVRGRYVYSGALCAGGFGAFTHFVAVGAAGADGRAFDARRPLFSEGIRSFNIRQRTTHGGYALSFLLCDHAARTVRLRVLPRPHLVRSSAQSAFCVPALSRGGGTFPVVSTAVPFVRLSAFMPSQTHVRSSPRSLPLTAQASPTSKLFLGLRILHVK